jgi:hypothetical protein
VPEGTVRTTPEGMFPPTLPMNVMEEPDTQRISEALELRQAVYGAAGRYSEPLSVVVDPGRPEEEDSVRVGISGVTVKGEELTTSGVPDSEMTVT